MLPNSPQVDEVALGENGLIYGTHENLVLIDMSSIAPLEAKRIGAELRKKGIEMLDAPVSGGEPKAIEGTLSVMVGGNEEIFTKFVPLLKTMASSIVYTGELGAGNTTKLANQIIVALNIAALCEAYTLASKAGVDPNIVYQAIRGGLAGSTMMDAKSSMMMEHNFKPGFRIDLHEKDLRNVLDTASALTVPLPLTTQVFEMMKVLDHYGHNKDDHSSLLAFYELIENQKI